MPRSGRLLKFEPRSRAAVSALNIRKGLPMAGWLNRLLGLIIGLLGAAAPIGHAWAAPPDQWLSLATACLTRAMPS